MTVSRFRCPACGFQIFNRRVAKCESCGNALPAELLLTADEIAKLDADAEKSRKEQEARLKEMHKSRELTWGGEAGGGDGGGGD